MSSQLATAEAVTDMSRLGETDIPLPEDKGVHLLAELDYQPVGAAVDPKTGRLLVMDYFAPGVKIYEFKRENKLLRLTRDLGRVKHDDHLIRLFPELPADGGNDMSRGQGIAWTPLGSIFFQNGESDRFYRCQERYSDEKRLDWELVEIVNLLGNTEGYMEAAAYVDDRLYVVRSRQNGSTAWVSAYTNDGVEIPIDDVQCPEATFVYCGVVDGDIAFITDPRSRRPHAANAKAEETEQFPLGIYDRYGKLLVPGVAGTGVATLSDGTVIISRFGGGIRRPGALFAVRR